MRFQIAINYGHLTSDDGRVFDIAQIGIALALDFYPNQGTIKVLTIVGVKSIYLAVKKLL